MNLPTMSDGTLFKYTSVGCYPLFYLDSKDNVLCRSCAEESRESGDKDEKPVAYGVNWEDDSLFCDCGERIESAYADEE